LQVESLLADASVSLPWGGSGFRVPKAPEALLRTLSLGPYNVVFDPTTYEDRTITQPTFRTPAPGGTDMLLGITLYK
jgi:hypothetical protein